jgi:glycosyltransferase involved in cell wall biosynthesis
MARSAYRFGFVLTTGAGNYTRYVNLRRYAEHDPEIECAWAIDPGRSDPEPTRRASENLRRRFARLRLAAPVLRKLRRFDAVMFHTFEPYVLAALRSMVARRPLLVWSRDDPPTMDPGFWRHYGLNSRTASRTRLRFALDVWCARRVALFFPFSHWAADILVGSCHVRPDQVHVLHVGIDLDLWPYVPREARPVGRPRILFVGADYVRKGGDLLVDVYRQRFARAAELHLVTKRAPRDLPPGVFVYDHLAPNDPLLRRLYADADVFVLPTRSDTSSFAIMEAMASGVPVVASRVGGIADIVREGESGFTVPPEDASLLADRIEVLLQSSDRRRRMGAQGRAVVERDLNSAVNVPRMLGLMKRAVDAGFPSSSSRA